MQYMHVPATPHVELLPIMPVVMQFLANPTIRIPPDDIAMLEADLPRLDRYMVLVEYTL
jgi:hypothetical protein